MKMKPSRNCLADHLRTDGFVAYSVDDSKGLLRYTGRNEFHKIALISGRGDIHYDGRVYKIDGSVLLMTTPGIQCSWELKCRYSQSYISTFTDDFIKKDCLDWAEECAKYFTTNPVFQLRSEEETFIRSIFVKMIDGQTSSYSYREELIRDQICVISHLAFKKPPVQAVASDVTSHSVQLPAIRLELVEHQFPAAAQILHLN